MSHMFTKRQGFTLIELLVVIAIIATLAAIRVQEVCRDQRPTAGQGAGLSRRQRGDGRYAHCHRQRTGIQYAELSGE